MSEQHQVPTKTVGLGYAGWVVVYLGAMAVALAIFQSGLVTGRYAFLIMLAPLVLVPALSRAQMGTLARHGISSPALSRYSRRIMAAVLLMLFAIMGTVQFAGHYVPDPALSLVFAIAVAVPAIGCVWAMVRYLAEEEDEFLRHKAIGAELFSIGFVLVIAAVHGALQLFGLASPANSLWVLVAWAFGTGFGNLWQWMRGR